jgi:hypothetical protein
MPAQLHTLVLLFLLTISCSGAGTSSPQPGPEREDQTRARIENRSSIDMDIYVVRSDGRRHRLGFAPGGETVTFALTRPVTGGAASVTFEARPVRGSGRPVTSEPFGVQSGDEITWSIPPQ